MARKAKTPATPRRKAAPEPPAAPAPPPPVETAIEGQERARESLRRAVAAGRIAHAYLFHGPRGVGKCAVARAFARDLLCETPRKGLACGACASCRAFAAGEHPDFDVLAPAEGARQVLIETVRDMIRRAHLSPSCSPRRVFLLDDAHALTEEASNALLKTLEEPPPGTVLLLVTFKPESLLATVLSRAQPIGFRALPEEACARLLAERHGVPAEEARELAALALGAPGQALGLRTTPAFLRREEIFEQILAATRARIFKGAEELLAVAAEGAGGKTLEQLRQGVRRLFQILGAFLRDVHARSRGGGEILNRSKAALVDKALAAGGASWAGPAWEALGRASRALERNVTPVLVVEWWLSALVAAKDERGS